MPDLRDFPSPLGELGDWGSARSPRAQLRPSTAAESWPIDSILPRRMRGTVALAIVVAIASWLAGLALAPDIPKLLASPEWQIQPLYFAAHIIGVRLFVHVYTRGFLRGVSYLDVPAAQTRSLVASVLGLPGAVAALAIAMPFIALDFLYLFSDRYEHPGRGVMSIDYLMWGVWAVEWFLNAFIWVVLIGFLVKTCGVIRYHPFRAPIEIVLHDRQYKPFLQMSAQGASIVFAFTIVTAVYIWYTGGEITDYAGLAITATLLLASFFPPWLLLRSKVHRAVEAETLVMRRQLLRNLELAESGADAASLPSRDRSLQHRLDAAVAILRISYLEGRHHKLGSTEARAVLLRMLAPAASVGWHYAKTYADSFNSLLAHVQSLL
jgi:hypothetical protein